MRRGPTSARSRGPICLANCRELDIGLGYGSTMSLPSPVMRALNVLGFALGLCLVVSMINLAFNLSTWPFRLLAAAIAIYVAFRLLQVIRSIRRNGWSRAEA